MSSGSACWILWLTPMDWLALSIGRSGSQPLEYSLNIFVKEDEESNNISGYTLPGVPSMLVVENGELKTSLSGAEPINEELKKEALNS